MATILYHNPRCAISRAVLGLLREAGVEPVIIEYLKMPPDHKETLALLLALDIPPRALLRQQEKAYSLLDLASPDRTDREIVDAIVAHPELIERPIVLSDRGARICRPAERVLDLLETPSA